MKSNTLPTRTYDFYIHPGADLERILHVVNAYGEDVDIRGASYTIHVGYLVNIMLPTNIMVTKTGTIPSDMDAEKGWFMLRLTAADLQPIFDEVPVGLSSVRWSMDVTVASGTYRVYHGEVGIIRD